MNPELVTSPGPMTDPVPIDAEAPALNLVDQSDAVTHLMCCRTAKQGHAFCGAYDLVFNPDGKNECTMCLAEAEVLLPGCRDNYPTICPVDRNPCASDAERGARIAQALGWT